MDTPLQLFTWLAFLLVLFFYCIPKSKRSVYLLPCYPFMAYLIAEYIVWMMKEKLGAIKVFACTIGGISILLFLAFLAVKCNYIPDSIFHGKHAADNIAMLHALRDIPFISLSILVIIVATAVGAHAFTSVIKHESAPSITYKTLASIVLIFLSLDAAYQPVILNTKADKQWAPVIEKKFDTHKLYSYMGIRDLHFFSLNFYLGDKIQQFDKVMPDNGVLMIPEEDMEGFKEKYGKGYTFEKVWEVKKLVEWHHPVGFYRFVKNEANLAIR